MDDLKITFVNVGYGEAALISCRDDACRDGVFTMLIDGGSGEPAEYAPQDTGRIRLRDYLRRCPLPHLDLLVSTHIHEDHICGLDGLTPSPTEVWQTLPEKFWMKIPELPVEETNSVSANKFVCAINSYRTLCRDVTAAGGQVRKVCAQEKPISLCQGLSVRVLSPSPARCEELESLYSRLLQSIGSPAYQENLRKLDVLMNNFSLILMLEYGKTKILLPGDTNAAGYGDITQSLHADLFKMGHHGQKDAVSPDLAKRVCPVHAVCCASSDRRYQSASPEALNLLRSSGAALWFSDCPEGQNVPPHQALDFLIHDDGRVEGSYRNLL